MCIGKPLCRPAGASALYLFVPTASAVGYDLSCLRHSQKHRYPSFEITARTAACLFRGGDFLCRREKSGLVAQRLSSLQGVGDALLRFALAAEGDEGFAFKVEEILFADELR